MSCRCSRRFFLRSALLALSGLAESGCAVFERPAGKLFNRVFKVPAIGLPPNAVQLDIVYVERPVGDELLGDAKLWRFVDELGIDRQHRLALDQNGFRAGVAGSNPPQALQQMLGLTADYAYEPEAEKAKGLIGHRYIVSSGGQTTVQVSPVYPECSLELPSRGDPSKRTLKDVACKYRIRAERKQDGWVELQFVPQIHHGDLQMRRVATDSGLQLQSKQLTETFFPQQFCVRLSVGEMAVVTAADDSQGRLGELFFRGPQALAVPDNERPTDGDPTDEPAPPSDVQRVLIVRLAGMGDVAPPATGK